MQPEKLPPPDDELKLQDLQALAEWRHQIRKFLACCEDAARSAGIEPQHHQLLLAIKGLPTGMQPTISVIAARMAIRHHSAVELIDRLVERGLVKRGPAPRSRRSVVVTLTHRAEWILKRMADQHRHQLTTALPALMDVMSAFGIHAAKSEPPEEEAHPGADVSSSQRP